MNISVAVDPKPPRMRAFARATLLLDLLPRHALQECSLDLVNKTGRRDRLKRQWKGDISYSGSTKSFRAPLTITKRIQPARYGATGQT